MDTPITDKHAKDPNKIKYNCAHH